ncbi:hypothetical protein KAR91_35775, partial [Candidatus Pacearchaeota archaeon]|nr:hypothetical protein [Candidatus Pacearchaeota archaeon]
WMDAYIAAGGEYETVKSTGKKPKDTVESCEKIEYELVELVEVVTQDEEKWVKGAGMKNTDKDNLKKSIERTEKDDANNYIQYINLDHDTEGKNKRHPEYGREITFKARIKRTDNKTEKLNGVKVKFSYKCTKAANRKNPDTKVWTDAKAKLTGDQKAGFDSKGGADTKTVQTDNKGWTTAVKFFSSAYGGDKFEVSAVLHPTVKGATGAQPKKTQSKYIVWRKFWYQMTYADKYPAPKPVEAEKAFAEVFAKMVKAGEKKFIKGDFPDDLQDRTFFKEYMLKKDGDKNKIVANVGADSNIDQFSTNNKLKLDTSDSKEHPIKGNLIICEYQCDPIGQTVSPIHELKKNGDPITLPAGTLKNPIISKPAIKANTKLVASGEWSRSNSPWVKAGDIVDKCIEIDDGRDTVLTVQVDLSKGATNRPPTPSDSHPVYIKLKLEAAKTYSGWATAAGIVAVYDPNVAAGESGSEKDFNDTAAHEFGHIFSQTPESTDITKLKSMKKHPLQYVGHGGSGPHCRNGAATFSMATYSWSENDLKFKTKIKNDANVATDTHQVKNIGYFAHVKGRDVIVDGDKKVLKKVKAGKKLQFTTSFTADKDDKVAHKINWQKIEDEPSPNDGHCIMFHSYSSKCKHKFCDTCKPYLQLQDMSSI